MLHKSLTGWALVFGGMVRDVAIGAAAGVVCSMLEASPRMSIALAKRMLRSDFDRMRYEFAQQGCFDVHRVDDKSRERGKVWH